MSKILAKDAIPNMIYAVRGGTCNVPLDRVLWDKCEQIKKEHEKLGKEFQIKSEYEKLGGKFKKVAWGFDRVRVSKITDKLIICEAGWNPILELPLDYSLYETELQTISTTHLFKLSGRNKEDTIELEYDEAIKQGYITETEAKIEGSIATTTNSTTIDELTKSIITKLSTEEGATLRDLALMLNITYQKARHRVLRLPELGYKIHKNDSIFRIEKR